MGQHKEGGLKAPTRHPIPWEDEAFYDEKAFLAELRRVSDICHTCRRCFNLCAAFPKLFDLIDTSKTGELDSVTDAQLLEVTDLCTLCDMCYMTKCPYVPPHPFNIDFPHLIVRARAIQAKRKGVPLVQNQLTQTDRNGCIGCAVAPLANWARRTQNTCARTALQACTGIDKNAHVPAFAQPSLRRWSKKVQRRNASGALFPVNKQAPGFGEHVALYSTCFATWHDTAIAKAALAVLAHNGVHADIAYPECCGMPRWEQGHLSEVAQKAKRITQHLKPFLERGLKVISLVPSCTLMLKTEWPLLWPKDPDIRILAQQTMDIAEYLVWLAQHKGLAPGLRSLGRVTAHIACHARAQNQGRKAHELLAMLPETEVHVIERCSGHGGTWGMLKPHFQTALAVGKPVFKATVEQNAHFVASECPLAAQHIAQGVAELQKGKAASDTEPSTQVFQHPIQLMAQAWGLVESAG
jgi:glycerol-3-phosphate dehydrogenase subunit C